MTGAEALPNGAEQDWGSSWGLPGEGKQQWRSAACEGWRWEPWERWGALGEGGALCWSCCSIQQQLGHADTSPSSRCWCRLQDALWALLGCTGLFYAHEARLGFWGMAGVCWRSWFPCWEGLWSLCLAGQVGGPLPALASPAEQGTPLRVTTAKCHQQPRVWCVGSEGGGGGSESCLPKPGDADFNLFPPLHEAQNLHRMFFPKLLWSWAPKPVSETQVSAQEG